MQQQHKGQADLDVSGAVRAVRTRDLGVLQPPAKPTLAWRLKNAIHYRRRDLPKLVAARVLGALPGTLVVEARLEGRVFRADWSSLAPWQIQKLRDLLASPFDARNLPAHFGGFVTDYGVLSTRVVTTAGVNFLADAFQGLVEPELVRFHAFGTGTNAEASGDTALQTELTTQYATDNTRPTGSQTEGATANVYRSVATLAPDASVAITEHGMTTQAATGGGTLWDRSVFSAVNLTGSVDSLQVQYDLTMSAGG
jgi:hypothetical protein